MTKAWLRQVTVLCMLHSTYKVVLASIVNLKLRTGKPLESYIQHDPDEGDPLARCQALCY